MSSKRVAVLGSTGSVGTQALEVIEKHPDRLKVATLAAGENAELLASQVQRWQPELVSVASEACAARLRERLGSDAPEIAIGDDGLLRAVTEADAGVVLNAVVGAAGLAATYEAVTAGIDVALANKESLVMAGELIMSKASTTRAALLPVDSEPNALHQCLRRTSSNDVRRLILTASGGPFLGSTPDELAAVTPKQALDHPTWRMGPRITIDSATLMNKAFEVIECRWLFGLPHETIDVVIHPQSIVHSLVELVDGSMIAAAGPTDMRLPIQDALTYPERWKPSVTPLSLVDSSPWTFEAADPERYPALGLARAALERGGTAPAVLNAADEVAVEAFLAGRLPFDKIVDVAEHTLDEVQNGAATTLQGIFAADREARRIACRMLEELVM